MPGPWKHRLLLPALWQLQTPGAGGDPSLHSPVWLETKPGISSSCCPSLCGWGTPPWSEGRIQPCPSGIYFDIWCKRGFLGDSVVKILPANAGDLGSIPGLGRSPGEGTSNPLQYSCLGNPMDRGAWWAVVHGVTRVGHN